MREEAAQRVLLVQAVEEADRDGQLLTRDERNLATAAARQGAGTSAAELAERRAGPLLDLLSSRAPWVHPVLRVTRFPGGAVWILVAIAGLAGLATDALGPERRINILSVPILGLIAWNLAVYAALAVAAAVRASRHGPRAGTERDGAASRLLASFADWRARRRLGARGRAAELARRAATSYLGRWRPAVAPLVAARVRLLLHLGAALLAVGVLIGAYSRGIAFEYRATWESTFLGPRELRAVLVPLLGPASALLGQRIPTPEALAELRAPSSGDAAPWIHRYAVATGMFVLVPRALLAALAWRRARRLAADLPFDASAAYFARLVAGGRGAVRIDVVPYGLLFGAGEDAALRRLLDDAVGSSADIRVQASAPYGADAAAVLAADPLAAGDAAERWLVVVFNLAQSPEREVHGELLSRLVGWTAAGDGGRRSLAVVDAAPYRARLSGTGAEERRLAERRRAWDVVARASGSALVHLDLGAAETGAVRADLERAVWSPAPTR